tara:strand:+ start:662 stop:985 length:324 start_codon:yes stop_codon:yes gene_type:complete
MKRAVWTKEKGNHEVDMTPEEITQKEIDDKAWSDKLPERQLEEIRFQRNKKLSDTDWLVTSNKISEAETTWRENLRNIPQDYSEEQYNDLLATDEQGNLTHTVWSKP